MEYFSQKDDYMFETYFELDGCLLESELACSKATPRINPSLIRYKILFKDVIITPNTHSGENKVEGIACLKRYSLYANPIWCDNMPTKDENLCLEDDSTLKGE